MTKQEAKKYQTRDADCWNRECFVPYSGNGIKICRLYELGQCPPEDERKIKKNVKQ